METDPFLLCWCKKIAGRPSGPALPGAIWEWVQRIHPFSFSCYIFGAINFSKYSNSRRAMSLQPHIQRLQRAHESPGDLVKMQISIQFLEQEWGVGWGFKCLPFSQDGTYAAGPWTPFFGCILRSFEMQRSLSKVTCLFTHREETRTQISWVPDPSIPSPTIYFP